MSLPDLRQRPTAAGPTQPGDLAPRAPDAVAPVTLGPRYVLERPLAAGGMGRLFVARDLRLDREVAVKLMRGEDPRLLRRFEREARITARLGHPGIVRVHDSGVSDDGVPYLVLDLVRGRPLDRVFAEAESIAERLALLPLLLAVAEALAYAHDRGVVHRDLKPGNVLVGAFGEVVVIDWGLAKEIGRPEDDPPEAPAGPTSQTLSRPGAVLGTPAYMAPEQAAGDPVDARADVYALGALLYELLSGTPPHTGGRTTEVVGAARAGTRAPLGTLEPGLPRALVAIAETALAFDRDRRYPTAFELAEDLKRFLAGQIVSAHRYSALELGWRWVARSRWALLAAAAAALAWWSLR